MKPVAIMQNEPIVPPGTIIDYFEEKEIPYKLIKTYADEDWGEIEEYRAVIVLGSSQSAMFFAQSEYLARLFGFIREAVTKRLAIMGICFGSQLLAMVLGAEVVRGAVMELGKCGISLTDTGAGSQVFRGCAQELVVFQWHRDQWKLPDKADLLAGSDICSNQAFRYRKSVGIQFHPEMNLEMVKNWCDKFSSDLKTNQKTADGVIGEYEEMAEELRKLNYTILDNFLMYTTKKEPGL